jgi:hypothetical protein
MTRRNRSGAFYEPTPEALIAMSLRPLAHTVPDQKVRIAISYKLLKRSMPPPLNLPLLSLLIHTTHDCYLAPRFAQPPPASDGYGTASPLSIRLLARSINTFFLTTTVLSSYYDIPS